MNKGLSWFVLILLVGGYLFLYGPILSLIIFSFNVSKLVTVLGGFSTKWYGALLNDRAIMDAVKLSLWIAAPLAWWLGADLAEKLLLWPALSAGAIMLERATGGLRTSGHEQAVEPSTAEADPGKRPAAYLEDPPR